MIITNSHITCWYVELCGTSYSVIATVNCGGVAVTSDNEVNMWLKTSNYVEFIVTNGGGQDREFRTPTDERPSEGFIVTESRDFDAKTLKIGIAEEVVFLDKKGDPQL